MIYTVVVQLYGGQEPLRIEADFVQDNERMLLLYNNDQQIASFDKRAVSHWQKSPAHRSPGLQKPTVRPCGSISQDGGITGLWFPQ
jgi:hypothetical protein